tara:strand:- start:163 stop:570 length:408 start_codon:yes stop_codon:yes gene_type:complete
MNEFELFQGTSFSDLMKDVYHNSKKKSRQIDSLIQDLKPLIKNIGDATVIAPLLKDYLEVSVKNDDALVKLAAVVQRLVTASNKDEDGNEFGMSDEERKRLVDEATSELEKIHTENKEHIIKDRDEQDIIQSSNS